MTRAARAGTSGLVIVALAAVLLATVGTGVTSATPADAAPDGPVVAGADDPLPPDLRAWVEAHGPLVVGYADNPPVSVVEDGVATGGWAVEVMELVALKLGIDVEARVSGGIQDVVAELRDGTVDVAAGFGPRDDLASFATMGEPVGWAPIVAVVRDDDPARSLADLAGGTVTTIPGSPIEAIVADRLPDTTYVPTADIPSGIDAVAGGDVDAYVGPLAIIGSRLRDPASTLRPIDDPLQVVEVGAWARTGSEAARVLAIGRSLVTGAELQVIHVRWTGFDLGDPAADDTPAWLVPLLVALALTAVVLGVFAAVLRVRVRHATARLRSVNDELEDRVRDRTADLDRSNALLARSNAVLADVARRAAHDLQSPLRSIVGLTERARTQEDPERRDQLLDVVGASGRRLTDHVEELLRDARDVTSAGAGTVGSVREMLVELFGDRLDGVALSVTEDDVEGLAVPGPLRRGTVNLVENALRYGGEAVTVDVGVDEASWTVVVADDGPGLGGDPEHWFEHGTTTGTSSGTGLHTTRGELRERGGDLVADPVAAGTSLRMTLPRTT